MLGKLKGHGPNFDSMLVIWSKKLWPYGGGDCLKHYDSSSRDYEYPQQNIRTFKKQKNDLWSYCACHDKKHWSKGYLAVMVEERSDKS